MRLETSAICIGGKPRSGEPDKSDGAHLLDLVGDVEVDGVVEQVTHALVVPRVQALHDHDGRGLDLLGLVQGAGSQQEKTLDQRRETHAN